MFLDAKEDLTSLGQKKDRKIEQHLWGPQYFADHWKYIRDLNSLIPDAPFLVLVHTCPRASSQLGWTSYTGLGLKSICLRHVILARSEMPKGHNWSSCCYWQANSQTHTRMPNIINSNFKYCIAFDNSAWVVWHWYWCLKNRKLVWSSCVHRKHCFCPFSLCGTWYHLQVQPVQQVLTTKNGLLPYFQNEHSLRCAR